MRVEMLRVERSRVERSRVREVERLLRVEG